MRDSYRSHSHPCYMTIKPENEFNNTCSAILRSITPLPVFPNSAPMPPMSIDKAKSAAGESPPRDYTLDLPDECLACIFQSLLSDDRNRCSLVSRRWLRIEGQSRHRLSLNAQSDLASAIPSIFARFDSVTELTLKCYNKSESIGDEALILISLKCKNLTGLTLRACSEITADGVEALSKNCALLKKLSCSYCSFTARGMNAVLNNCAALEELYLKKLTGITEPIGPGSAGSSLKVVCLEGLDQCQCFGPLITASKSLTTLKLLRCSGPLDALLQSMADSTNEEIRELNLEHLDVSNVGLMAISSCCPNLKFLRLVKPRNCTNAGIVMAAKEWRSLTKLLIEVRKKSNRIGSDSLMAVAENCPNLEVLLLIGVKLTLPILEALATKCVKLDRFGFGDCQTMGDPELLCIAANCNALKKLWIKNCPVSDHGIQALAENFPNLDYLGLIGVNLTKFSLETLAAKCVSLEMLDLMDCETVGDVELFCIAANCNALKKLWIKNCPVSDLGIKALASGCPSLVEVKLKNCRAVTLEGADCLRITRASLAVVYLGMSDVPNKGTTCRASISNVLGSRLIFYVIGVIGINLMVI